MFEFLSYSEKTLSQEIFSLHSNFTTKDKIPCSLDSSKKLISELKKEYPESDITDGIKIQINQNSWVMIRPSGTEPIIRIYAEAENQEKLDSLMSKFIKKSESIISR